MRSDILGYFKCEGENCDFKAKRVKSLIYFKGKRLCKNCKLKNSKSLNYLPKLNITESTLKSYIPLPREKKKKIESKIQKIEIDNKFSVSITHDEYQFFKRQLIKKGYTGYEAHKKIGELIEVIKLNHKKYKKKEINFTEEFNKLI